MYSLYRILLYRVLLYRSYFRFLFDYTGASQGLACGNLGEIVENAKPWT
jgi:hypothetical protein